MHATPPLPGAPPDALRSILVPGRNLALWERAPDGAIVDEVAALPANAFPDVRGPVSAARAEASLADLLASRGCAAADFPAWHADMADLVRRFCALAGGRPVIARLETMTDAVCPRFHVDRTHLRLLCTYRGPATEWLANAQVDRDALAQGLPNEAMLRADTADRTPRRWQAFWVGIMKGEDYPGNAGNGLVHRSPPLYVADRARVLFCLDA
jgi:hypothetical protein